MFGRSSWFTFRPGSSRPSPRTWQGWAYLAAWSGVVVAPALLFAGRHQGPEMLVWLAAASSACIFDLRRLRRSADEPLEVREIFVIDDHGARMERAG